MITFPMYFVNEYLSAFISLEKKKAKNTELSCLLSTILKMKRDWVLESFAKAITLSIVVKHEMWVPSMALTRFLVI